MCHTGTFVLKGNASTAALKRVSNAPEVTVSLLVPLVVRLMRTFITV